MEVYVRRGSPVIDRVQICGVSVRFERYFNSLKRPLSTLEKCPPSREFSYRLTCEIRPGPS